MTSLSAPSAPRIDHRTDPGPVLGVTNQRPRLSWTVASAPEDYVQSAYELEIVRGDEPMTWRVTSGDQVLVPWPGAPLEARESATVRVRVQGSGWSQWSEPTTVEAGLLAAHDWTAKFISPVGIGGLRQAAPELLGVFQLPDDIASARLYATAHGIFTARLNSRLVDDTVLAPGWTSYHHRLRYRAYDVTDLVKPGRNELTAILGNGWWRGRLGFLGERAFYGDRLALLAQLEVKTSDGTVHTFGTDGNWHARPTGVLVDDIYDGQTTDLRADTAAPYESAVEEVPTDLGVLVGEDGPPVRVTDTLAAVRVWTSPSGKTLVDFGQNVVGWARLYARATRAGTEVTVRHAEVLDAGELAMRPLRSARATDTYFLRGDDEEILEPSLTFHGFRYAEITGLSDIRPDDVEAIVIGSDLQRTGWFDSSHALLNRFHENVVWGMRGNFVDVPTDCPQRDERLGWTGDIQVFSPTATFLHDSSGFLTSWLADLAAEQERDGSVPHVVPDILRTPMSSAPAAAWGDAATVVPWVLWERTGDKDVLARQFDSMRAWVDKIDAVAGDDLIWRGGNQYGDWLDPTAPPEAPDRATADPDVIATAHFARSAQIVADAAQVLDRVNDAAYYGQLAERVRAAFASEFVTPAGRVLSDAQTVYAIALEWGLLTDTAQRRTAGSRLADLVRAGSFRIATGFVGTPVICDALMNAGYSDLAFRLLLQTECPSWLYPVTMGATTVWERWDSMLPDGSINPGEMTSFNHYALGSIVDWVHRRIAGLAPAEPGYRTISVRPVPPRGLTHASARHRTPYGEASVSWHRDAGTLTLAVRVPVGSRAEVELPWGAGTALVGHGDHTWQVEEPRRGDRPMTTVRDVIDDAALWRSFVDVAVDGGLASSETSAARLLAPHLDRPATELLDAVWTRSWPSDPAKARLADVLRPYLGHVEHAAQPDLEPTGV